MRITFLGTSHGVPSAERFCSSIMIEAGESIYLIDAGAPVLDQMIRLNKDFMKTRAFFSTHAHYDHSAGLPALISLMHHKHVNADLFFTSEAIADGIERLVNAFSPTKPINKTELRFHVIAPTKTVYKDENITVEFIPTQHMWWEDSAPSDAILVTEGDKRVLFSGDLSHKLSKRDLPTELLKTELDAFICELAHFDVADIEPHLAESNIKRLFVTHVYPLEKYEQIKGLDGKYGFELFTPSDGDGFNI